MQTKTLELSSGVRKAAAIAVCALCVAALLLFVKWAFGHAVAKNAAQPEVRLLGVDLAPSDPHAHYAFGQQLERTFLPTDQQRALAEFETAAALSPHNYEFWLGLARAQEQSGDIESAERVLRKAQELAPHYSRVQWALGNVLLRRGREDEAFSEIRTAAAGDGTFAGPAASAAWQIFRGDVQKIHSAVGESSRINASLAVLLANDKRYAEAMDFWRRAASEKGEIDLKEPGQVVYNKLVEGGMYRSAVEIAAGAGLFPNDDIAPATVSNGGFERPLAPAAANAFTWSVAGGTFPRVGSNGEQKRSGSYSLLITFGKGGTGFRPVTQKVAVEPGGSLELQLFYRSEVTTPARVRCDVFAASGDPLGGATLLPTADWSEIRIPFTVPADSEGVEIRLGMEGCPAAGCTAAGSIWFDDFNLLKR